MVLFNTSSLNSTSGIFLRKRRKWPSLRYKGKWQQSFNEQQAMEVLRKAATEATSLEPTQPQHGPEKANFLSVLVSSFNTYCCDPTPSAYSFVIKALTRNSHFDQLPSVLDRIEKVEKFEPPERMFIDLIRIYGDANKLQDAIAVFFRMPKFRCTPSVDSLNALLLVLCERKEGLQMVHRVLLQAQSLSIRLEESSFRILIETLCKIKKVGYAIELLNSMPDYGYSPDSRLYSSVLYAMCESREFSSVEVLGFLEAMRKEVGFIPNEVDYNNVISFLGREGKGKDALDLMNQMKSDRIKPDIVCYNTVLDGLIFIRDFKKVEEVFDELLVLGIAPDLYTYNVYINGLCKQNKLDMGLKMLNYMDELCCKPDAITYNTLLKAFCKVGELKRGREILKMMRLKGVEGNLHTYRIFIDGLIREDELVEALDVLEEMLHKGLVPLSSSFDQIISGLCKRGHACEALQVLNLMLRRDVPPGAITWEALLLLSRSKLDFHQTHSAMLEELISLSGNQFSYVKLIESGPLGLRGYGNRDLKDLILRRVEIIL